jgi:hypothetical protein
MGDWNTLMKSTLYVLWFILIALLGADAGVSIYKYYTCDNRYAHGNRHYKTMCFERGHCPQEDR